ncbi:ty3-gypsy retrotransposon protein [Cucumis melo var. makuwa]|uniref:Ty3-gypsy retrotransposon protein n=1 Tax=Cucumis melo var. makuwa TaxID=1194695 RepID=A0A5D3BX51_CUCMM|nr:ty3-gypsy retrotransposon protein [Cucumis melo var. makuwa]
MALRKVALKATVAKSTDSRLFTQSHLKRSMKEQEQSFVLIKKSWEQLVKSLKGGIIIRENPFFDNSTPVSDLSEKEPNLEIVFVMMANVTTEAAVTYIERKINFLMKAVEEHDHDITTLKGQMKACETAESSKTEQLSKTSAVQAYDKGKAVLQNNHT